MGPSADWDPLGSTEAFYRKIRLYSLTWQFPGGDLSDYIFAGARNGGPVALTRDESKPILVKDSSVAGGKKKRVWVYSSSGTLLQSITWDHSSRIVKMGFTQAESLVILAKDGIYRLYNIAPTVNGANAGAVSSGAPSYSQHSLAHDVQDSTVVDARIYDSGMIVLLSSHQFLEVKGWPERDALADSLSTSSTIGAANDRGYAANDEAAVTLSSHGRGRVERLIESTLEKAPSAWCILTPDQSTSRQAEVLASANEALLSIDQLEVQDQRFSRGPFSRIVPSPSGRFIALLTQSQPQKLYVVSSNFSETLTDYALSSEPETSPPQRMLWCGNNSVILAWESTIVMVGPYGETLRYYYNDPIHLVNEIDGVRIFSADRCEFLQKVPPSTVAVFQPGSVHPSAILYEAFEDFTARKAHAHESILSIRQDLVEAVDTCIDAAAREYDLTWQKKLLKTAAFGKTFLDLYNPAEFVNVSQILRVLNAVRFYEIGIPISYEQYLSRPGSTLISRLTLRNQHLLSLRISSFLKLSSAPVLRHWAQSKVSLSKNEQEDAHQICMTIVKRLREEGAKGSSEVSCADVAKTAWEQGKMILATKLLEHEPRAGKQVLLLLNMQEDNLALSKATRSGDSDFILSVLLSLRRKHSLGNFFRFLDGKPEAAAILTNYCKKYDKELIRDFWFQDDRRVERACFDLEEAAAIRFAAVSGSAGKGGKTDDALSPEEFGTIMDKVRNAQKTFGEDKERGFESKMCDEQLRLLAFQQSLRTEAGGTSSVPFVGLSLNETIRQCLISNWTKRAEKLRSDFKVPDKRWWYIKLKALVENRDWDGLEQFAKSKRSPIGYEPFVEHLIATGNPRQAVQYVQRCEGRLRSDLYVKTGEWVRAGEECRDRGDRGKLNDLIQRAPNNLIQSQLSGMLDDTRSTF